MGSVVSIPTALSVALITGGILYGFLEKRPPPPAWNAPSFVTDSSAANNEKEKKKGKKKKGGKAEAKDQTAEPNVVSFPAVVPGAFESAPATPPEPASTTTTKPKSKKKKTKKSTTGGSRPIPGDQQSESSATAPESSVSRPRKSIGDGDGAWTRVETKKRVVTSASANGSGSGNGKGVATSVTTSSSVAEDSPEEGKKESENGNRRTLAEKLLPKARKTGVEDMLQTPDQPPLSRVLRVTPRADEHPAAGFSWGDYEDVEPSSSTPSGASRVGGVDGGAAVSQADDDVDGEREDGQKEEEDDGWVTKSSKRPTRPKPTTTPSSTTPTTSELAQSSPDALTKKQRQNAAKRASQKSFKALAEAERLSALAKHKRELEQLRIREQAASAKGKREGAGMVGSVNERGQLVWD